MSWSRTQQVRLTTERDILEKYFSDKIKWIDPTNASQTRVELELKSSSDKSYKLRLYLMEDFPNSCPHMAIVYPTNLRTKNNRPLPLLDKSFHTLGLTVDQFTKLCHFSPDLWTADNTLYQVLIKGIMWIEAYEGHLETGKPMDHYLGEQREAVQGQGVEQEPTESVPEPQQETARGCCIS
jgi:hypothetical protein